VKSSIQGSVQQFLDEDEGPSSMPLLTASVPPPAPAAK
jgi:hypothetical protein